MQSSQVQFNNNCQGQFIPCQQVPYGTNMMPQMVPLPMMPMVQTLPTMPMMFPQQSLPTLFPQTTPQQSRSASPMVLPVDGQCFGNLPVPDPVLQMLSGPTLSNQSSPSLGNGSINVFAPPTTLVTANSLPCYMPSQSIPCAYSTSPLAMNEVPNLPSMMPPMSSPMPLMTNNSLVSYNNTTLSVSRSVSPVGDWSDDEDFMQSRVCRSRSRTFDSDTDLKSLQKKEKTDSPTNEMSKQCLVEKAFVVIEEKFGSRMQENGMRGETVLRIKVKTRTALEMIVPLIDELHTKASDLISVVCCPKSTKKGRQHLRGFLVYLQATNVQATAEIKTVFDNFNQACINSEGNVPFKPIEINPQSKKKM